MLYIFQVLRVVHTGQKHKQKDGKSFAGKKQIVLFWLFGAVVFDVVAAGEGARTHINKVNE